MDAEKIEETDEIARVGVERVRRGAPFGGENNDCDDERDEYQSCLGDDLPGSPL